MEVQVREEQKRGGWIRAGRSRVEHEGAKKNWEEQSSCGEGCRRRWSSTHPSISVGPVKLFPDPPLVRHRFRHLVLAEPLSPGLLEDARLVPIAAAHTWDEDSDRRETLHTYRLGTI